MWKRGSFLPVVTMLALLLAAEQTRADEPIAVVVSRSWEQLRETTLPQLRRIYLGRITRTAGARIDRFHLRSDSEGRRGFTQTVLGRDELEMTDHWIKEALSGGSIPPRELASPAELLRLVAERVGAIGYVPLSLLGKAEGLRVLGIIYGGAMLMPTESGYPIRTQAR